MQVGREKPMQRSYLSVCMTRFSLSSMTLSVSSREHASSSCFSRLIDRDVIAACNCNSHLAESFLESQNRIFLSKCPLIRLPAASLATRSWHFDPAKRVRTPEYCRAMSVDDKQARLAYIADSEGPTASMFDPGCPRRSDSP